MAVYLEMMTGSLSRGEDAGCGARGAGAGAEASVGTASAAWCTGRVLHCAVLYSFGKVSREAVTRIRWT